MSEQNQTIEIGKIIGCHGIQGWIKVFSHTDPIANIFSYKNWTLHAGNNSQKIKVIQFKANGKKLIAQLEGVNSRNEAEEMVGRIITMDELPALSDDDFYWSDLIGLTVFDTADKQLGKVKELLSTNANDVLVILDEFNKRHLIPYTYGVHVIKVDLAEQKITVDWGLDYD